MTAEQHRRLNEFAQKGKSIVDSKRDGKVHRVRVVISQWGHYNWMSLLVDETREAGGKLGVGSQRTVCDFKQKSKRKSAAKVENQKGDVDGK